jgi:coenzyme Q-binding protein COQ10
MTSNVDGPFRHLENEWKFHPHPEGCRVEFSICYAFRGLALEVLVGGVFARAFRKFAQAFEARADAIYKPPGAAALHGA